MSANLRSQVDDYKEGNFMCSFQRDLLQIYPGNTKGGSINVPLTSCLTGLD